MQFQNTGLIILFYPCSPWDMSRFMANQCHASGIPMPEWSLHWVNVRKLYANFYDCKRQKLSEMVDGLGLSFQGRLHSGIDDAQNIARIAMRMIEVRGLQVFLEIQC